MAELRHDSPEGLSESGKAGAESTTRFFAEIHESCRPSTSQALGQLHMRAYFMVLPGPELAHRSV